MEVDLLLLGLRRRRRQQMGFAEKLWHWQGKKFQHSDT